MSRHEKRYRSEEMSPDADVQDDDDHDARKQVCKSLDQVVDGGVGAGGAKTNLGATRLERQNLYFKKTGWRD